MSASLESHRDRYEPREWWLMMKMSVLYAQSFRARVFGDHDRITQSGEEILSITLAKAQQGCEGYIFKDGDILFFYYLCRCCRKTVLMLQQPDRTDTAKDWKAIGEDDDTPDELTEQVAVAFLQRRRGLEPFVSFMKEQKLKGKLRAYGTGFPRYGAENWDVERIAKDLRITPATVAKYRSRLREFLEEFEIQRARRRPA
jgi:hypothetical protein